MKKAVQKRQRHAMPAFMRDALKKNGLMELYNARPPYQRNDYIGWINQARREGTKEKRLKQMIAELKKGDVYMKLAWHAGKE
jgi:uncharacterized protein YdeI (YjbR/CyaY-like superfamily)